MFFFYSYFYRRVYANPMERQTKKTRVSHAADDAEIYIITNR